MALYPQQHFNPTLHRFLISIYEISNFLCFEALDHFLTLYKSVDFLCTCVLSSVYTWLLSRYAHAVQQSANQQNVVRATGEW